MKNYNEDNIFARIIKKTLSADIMYEDDIMMIIKDIKPLMKYHYLAICKIPSVDYSDFISKSSSDNIAHFFIKVREFADKRLEGYRLITNNGRGAGQEIFHFHLHILSDDEIKNND
ncbi:MAG TPA: HIT domain-containing protein [Candidatus Megaira endosymbiont of Hartmannula sinica]|nr:HIT domain-containing protein [Candidatus Megaera endosymbiont of Hartmannula sinica]